MTIAVNNISPIVFLWRLFHNIVGDTLNSLIEGKDNISWTSHINNHLCKRKLSCLSSKNKTRCQNTSFPNSTFFVSIVKDLLDRLT